MGIEPTSSAWKPEALPLSYARLLISVGATGFEPAISGSQSRRLKPLGHAPLNSSLSHNL